MLKVVALLILLMLTSSVAIAGGPTAEQVLRERTQQFLAARQARKPEQIRRFYDPQSIQEMHQFLKSNYLSVKTDMKKGIFTKEYVEQSVVDGNFGDSYKEAILNYMLKDKDIDQELDQAFNRFLIEFKYSITRFDIDEIIIGPDGKTASAKVVEYRQLPGDKTDPLARVYKWQLKNNTWYLSMESPAHL